MEQNQGESLKNRHFIKTPENGNDIGFGLFQGEVLKVRTSRVEHSSEARQTQTTRQMAPLGKAQYLHS